MGSHRSQVLQCNGQDFGTALKLKAEAMPVIGWFPSLNTLLKGQKIPYRALVSDINLGGTI
jgi:hypothetical protein